jgi:hypothetical protein
MRVSFMHAMCFDVCNLFPSIPRKEAVKVLQERLERDSKLIDRTMLTVEKIIELVELCVNSTYFQLGEDFYTQDEGLAKGSPLSPILADLFMEELEQKGLSTYNNGPRVWWRYVEDVFLIWKMNSGDLEEFTSTPLLTTHITPLLTTHIIY